MLQLPVHIMLHLLFLYLIVVILIRTAYQCHYTVIEFLSYLGLVVSNMESAVDIYYKVCDKLFIGSEFSSTRL